MADAKEALAAAVEAVRRAEAQTVHFQDHLPMRPPADGSMYQPIIQNFYGAAKRESPATVALRWVCLLAVVVGLLVVLSMFLLAFAIAALAVVIAAVIAYTLWRDVRGKL